MGRHDLLLLLGCETYFVGSQDQTLSILGFLAIYGIPSALFSSRMVMPLTSELPYITLITFSCRGGEAWPTSAS